MLGCGRVLRTGISIVPLLSTACIQPIGDAVADARRAYEEAVEAEADRYSPDSLALAHESLEAAVEEVERQGERMWLFRDHRRARAMLGQARQLARGAGYEAAARRDAVRNETAVTLELASRHLAALEEDMPDHVDPAERSSWLRQFRAASDALAEARRTFHAGDYVEARSEAARVVERLGELDGAAVR